MLLLYSPTGFAPQGHFTSTRLLRVNCSHDHKRSLSSICTHSLLKEFEQTTNASALSLLLHILLLSLIPFDFVFPLCLALFLLLLFLFLPVVLFHYFVSVLLTPTTPPHLSLPPCPSPIHLCISPIVYASLVSAITASLCI